jgi:hypothetical protein
VEVISDWIGAHEASPTLAWIASPGNIRVSGSVSRLRVYQRWADISPITNLPFPALNPLAHLTEYSKIEKCAYRLPS